MREEFSRAALLLGEEALQRLGKAHVAVFGVGGVGSFCCEALARAGIGSLSLFDSDTVARSNINRQIIALQSTVGRPKTEVMAERISDINPAAAVVSHPVFYTAENAEDFPLEGYDFIVDAIDTVSSKLILIERAYAAGVPIVSSMGTGNKLDPSRFRIDAIERTSVCPLARVMRYELKKRGLRGLRVLWSDEPPLVPAAGEPPAPGRRQTPGSLSFGPPVAGMLLAGEVVRSLAGAGKTITAV